VHGGLCARADGRRAAPGLLVSLRAVAFHCAYVDDLDGALTVEAERLLDAGTSWQYRFRVRHGERLLAEGRAAVMLRA
jgi:predicted hotdog family 3-hydroxylacyl-ACP dehydratase